MSDTSASPARQWPRTPYKGFSFYGPDDAPLFAGRERQVVEFARKIVSTESPLPLGSTSDLPGPDRKIYSTESRMILLHGATGCGKSSFLRAGVIPYLENKRRGFYFRKEGHDKTKAALIRSTSRPLQKLSEEVYEIARSGYEYMSAFNEPETTDLSKALLGARDSDSFVALVQNEPEKLVESLGTIASLLPVTLVLWIDQGEEVFSLGKGKEEEALRSRYFQFLASFGRSQFPLKLIIALRTDYFGLFLAALQKRMRGAVNIEYYLLESLSDEDLVRAIKRPTLDEEAPGYGRPCYNFEFDTDLPETIVRDLRETAERTGLVGGDLPILQAICETLYKTTKKTASDAGKEHWKISFADYKSLGKIETQLNDYVDNVLFEFTPKRPFIQDEQARLILRWKDALTGLYKTNRENAITTDFKTFETLREQGGKEVQKLDAETLLDLLRFLADDNQSILRKESIRAIGSSTTEDFFSLRHDAVGLVLKGWQDARKANATAVQGAFRAQRIGNWAMIIAGLGAFVVANFERAGTVPVVVALGYGFLLMGAALMSELRLRRTPREFLPFQAQLRIVPSVFSFPFTSTRIDTEDRLDTLQQDPVFRLYIRVNPRAQRQVETIRERLQEKVSRPQATTPTSPSKGG